MKEKSTLVLKRRESEKLKIGDDIEIIVKDIDKRTVVLVVRAPKDIRITRENNLNGRKDGTPE